MRERLIELIQNSVNGCARNWAEIIADYLLENGVIVPPVMVGDKVYYTYWFKGNKINRGTVEEIYFNGDDFAYHIYHDGIYCDLQHDEMYLTKEDAKQALKEREKI